MELLVGYLKKFPLDIGEGVGVRWARVRTYALRGVAASVHVRQMGERGSRLCHFGAYILIK